MNQKWPRLAALLLLLTFAISHSSFATDAPTLIPFQARLTNQAGVAYANGQYTITFNIYGVAVGGSTAWTERHEKVGVVNGMVNVFLGSIQPVTSVDFSTTRYLGITVDADDNAATADPEMVPRQMILPAFYAKDTQKLRGYDWTLITAGGTNNLQTDFLKGSKIEAGSITSVQIGTGQITTANLGNAQVTGAKLAPGAADSAISDESITSEKIKNGEVKTSDIADGGVGFGDIAPGAVSGDRIAASGVDPDRLHRDIAIYADVKSTAAGGLQLRDGSGAHYPRLNILRSGRRVQLAFPETLSRSNREPTMSGVSFPLGRLAGFRRCFET